MCVCVHVLGIRCWMKFSMDGFKQVVCVYSMRRNASSINDYGLSYIGFSLLFGHTTCWKTTVTTAPTTACCCSWDNVGNIACSLLALLLCAPCFVDLFWYALINICSIRCFCLCKIHYATMCGDQFDSPSTYTIQDGHFSSVFVLCCSLVAPIQSYYYPFI